MLRQIPARRRPVRRPRRSLLYWPLAAQFQAALALLLVGLIVLLQLGAFTYAYQRLGLDRSSLWLVLVATLMGSFVNLPVAIIRSTRQVSPPHVVRFFGMRYVIPARSAWGALISRQEMQTCTAEKPGSVDAQRYLSQRDDLRRSR